MRTFYGNWLESGASYPILLKKEESEKIHRWRISVVNIMININSTNYN